MPGLCKFIGGSPRCGAGEAWALRSGVHDGEVQGSLFVLA